MVEDQGRPARRRKSKKTVEQLKKEIADRDAAKAERAAARKANKKPLTPAEKYEQEKAARASRGSSGYGYSQHLMGGSGSSSGFNPRSVREEVLVDYLLDEGFASDEKSACAIVGAMSEAWRESIVEAEGDVNPAVGGKPIMVGGKPLSLSKKEFKWTQKMGELRRTDPKKYGEVKSLRGPHGWKQPPAGMKLPNWL